MTYLSYVAETSPQGKVLVWPKGSGEVGALPQEVVEIFEHFGLREEFPGVMIGKPKRTMDAWEYLTTLPNFEELDEL